MKFISARSQIRELVSRFETAMATPNWGVGRWTMVHFERNQMKKKSKTFLQWIEILFKRGV